MQTFMLRSAAHMGTSVSGARGCFFGALASDDPRFGGGPEILRSGDAGLEILPRGR